MSRTAANKYNRNSIAVVEVIREVWDHPQANNLELVVVGMTDGLFGVVTAAPKGMFRPGEKVAWFLPGACISENEANRMGVWKYLDHKVNAGHLNTCIGRYGIVGVQKIRGWKSHGFVHTLMNCLRNMKPGECISQFYGVWEEPLLTVKESDSATKRPYYITEDGMIHEMKYNVDGCFHWNLLDGDDEFDIEYPKDTLAAFTRLGTLCPNLSAIASEPLTPWQEEYVKTLDELAGNTLRQERQREAFYDTDLGVPYEPEETRSGNLYTPPPGQSDKDRFDRWIPNDEQQKWINRMIDSVLMGDDLGDDLGEDGMNTNGMTRDGTFYVRDTSKMTPEEIGEWMNACGITNKMYVEEGVDEEGVAGCEKPKTLRRLFNVVAGILKGFVAAWTIMILFPIVMGLLSYSTNFGGKADQEWLDRAQFRIMRLTLECKDPEVKKVLEYARKFREIGPFSVAVSKCEWAPCPKDMVVAGMNSPLCPGMTIDIKTTTDPIDEGALVIIHESLHDYFPFYGHGHVDPVMSKIEELNNRINARDARTGNESWEWSK